MDKRGVLASCIVGVVIMCIYICALMFGVEYNQIYGITIIQIFYIMFMMVYAGVIFMRKVKEEIKCEKIPVKVKNEEIKDEGDNKTKRSHRKKNFRNNGLS